MRNPIPVVIDGWNRSVEALRRWSPKFDHFWRTKQRYADVHAGRMAAAISYYGFFACFALALLAFAVLGYVLDNNRDVVFAVENWLRANLPFLEVANVRNAKSAVGITGLVGFLLTGIGWVEAMRASIRAVWLLDQEPGNYFIRRGVDILVLIGLGLLLALSIGFSVGAQAGIAWLRQHVDIGVFDDLLSGAGVVVAVFINWLLAAAMLTGLPRLKMPLGRWLPAGLLVAVGLELLKTVAQFYIMRVNQNPAYTVVAGAVGLLVFLNFFSQLLLWGSSLAATSDRGEVRDLAAGPEQALTDDRG
ncbi:hypothetical protein Lfu02_17140 [Longispora fulva]|uniref:Membrane protein n=1 Tax=Longispora fulva TaxID=619741 RepID=A0A8J7GWQ0_9ACTN|nr:YihY/virulence factor BrkB family protein [Longispora fulva]MBG6140279.1 membrane protein [Longispora fulva]GIG57342.1 hypothetical protein Lfu02_17140 [Longispora fulva]